MRTLIHDKIDRKFILKLENNEQAEVVYTTEAGILKLVYSEVPTHLRGQEIGKELVERTFEQLTNEGFKARAVCSYIRAIAMRSAKWKEIIDY